MSDDKITEDILNKKIKKYNARLIILFIIILGFSVFLSYFFRGIISKVFLIIPFLIIIRFLHDKKELVKLYNNNELDKLNNELSKIKCKTNKIVVCIVISIILIIMGIYIESRIIKIEKWNKIKGDYETLNNIAIEFYNNNANKPIFIYFGENYSSLIVHDFTTKDEKIITDLSQEEKNAMRNIVNFYPRQEVIHISEDYIEYLDADMAGACRVTYVIKKEKKYLKDFTHLTGNWYIFMATI